MAQRISRAKQQHQGVRRAVPDADAATSGRQRLRTVLHVLYLIFNEGYASSSRPRRCTAPSSSDEAIRLTRMRARGCCPTTARSPACSP